MAVYGGGKVMGYKSGEFRIDTQDIVGTIIGPYRVLKYYGIQKRIRKRYKNGANVHMYLTQCTVCGNEAVISRDTLNYAKTSQTYTRCSLCYRKTTKQISAVLESVESVRENKKATKGNLSTGIKRYCIYASSSIPDGYTHKVECQVDGQTYTLYKKYIRYEDKPVQEAIDIANQLNEVMSYGKEAFLQWYKENKENFK